MQKCETCNAKENDMTTSISTFSITATLSTASTVSSVIKSL